MAVRRDLLNKVSGFKCGPRYQHMKLRIGENHISITHTHLPPTRRLGDYTEPLHQLAALRNDEYTDILIGDLNAKITQDDVELLHKAR